MAAREARPASVAVVPLDDALAHGAPAWDSLRARAHSASPFTSWAWLDAWRAAAPPEDVEQTLMAAAVGVDGTPTAAVPLATRRTVFRRLDATALTWAIGDVGCPDHLDVLAAPDAPFDALVTALEDLDWDMLQLDGIASDAMGAPRLVRALERRGMAASLRPQWSCPYIELPSTWEAYLETRSPARRDVIARRERALARRGRMALTFYDGDALDEGWRHLLRLHDARWQGAGAFDARLDAMHRRFAASLSARGESWLSTIDVDGTPVSAWYGFVGGDTLHFYQSGRADAWRKFSVGAVHIGLMLQRAIAHGLRRFDFLRGDEPYKAEWTSTSRWTRQLIAFRRSARGRLLRIADQAGTMRERFARGDASVDHLPAHA